MSGLTVKIRWDLVPDDNEIKKMIARRSNVAAAEWNLKQAEKYAQYAAKTDSPEIKHCAAKGIEHALTRLEQVRAENAA